MLSARSGASRLDRSIYGAYVHAISAAQHYIYLENQYMSSNLAGGGVENVVAHRILDRLRAKIAANQIFRVIVVLPQPEESGDTALELLKWQYQTINRGGSSLLEQLHNEFPTVDLERYVSFYFLRQCGFICGKPVTEKVFTHSKLLIVDDRIALVSSANFNDRSFLGDRDSELGITVEDEESVSIMMNGEPFNAGRFPHDLRMQLCDPLVFIAANSHLSL
jgi:phospholipase D1/2